MRYISNSKRLPELEIVTRVIKNFVVKHRRVRYLPDPNKPSRTGRYGFGELAHLTHNLDLRYCRQIPGSLQNVEHVLKEIRSLTKSTGCYIIHESAKWDGKRMIIDDALKEIMNSNLGAFIVVDNGDIIYHESENIKERYIRSAAKLPAVKC